MLSSFVFLRILSSTSFLSSGLVQKNQSSHFKSSVAVIRSSATPQDPAGDTITSSPGFQSAGVATENLSECLLKHDRFRQNFVLDLMGNK